MSTSGQAGGAQAVLVESLTRHFGDRAALCEVSFAVAPGEILGLLGPNGGGKTTLFRILCTLLRPTGGAARVFGFDVVERPADVRRQIGVVFQSPSLDGKLTCRENLQHQGHLYGLRGRDLRTRIDGMLDELGVADRADDKADDLSGGLRRRVELAKVFLHRPRLLLLDEPSTGLDPLARRDLWQRLAGLRDALGTTILLTTHILEEAAGADRVAILDRGRLVACDRPARLIEQLGKSVITLRAARPAEIADEAGRELGAKPLVLGGEIRIESDSADGQAELAGRLMRQFGGRIESLTIGRPTLEDVFVHHTGHAFSESTEVAGDFVG